MNLNGYQERVWRWCKHTFDGIALWNSDKERAYRFFEEASELFQAMGMTKDDAYKIVDYVYGRPVGEKSQEVGGVMVTLLALGSCPMEFTGKIHDRGPSYIEVGIKGIRGLRRFLFTQIESMQISLEKVHDLNR
jgi:hypothetical protein